MSKGPESRLGIVLSLLFDSHAAIPAAGATEEKSDIEQMPCHSRSSDCTFRERGDAEKAAMKMSTEEEVMIVMAADGWKIVVKDRPAYLYPPDSIWCKHGIAVAL